MHPRLQALGFSSYQDYLKSDHWFKVRTRLRNRRCLVCNHHITELHHVTYERLGCERDDDLRPLCPTHHEMVHGIIGYQLAETDLAIAELKRIAPEPPPKPKPPKKWIKSKKHRKQKRGPDPFPGLGKPARKLHARS